MITTILFDLDGTLLPMDTETFTGRYFGLLAGRMAAHGYEPKKLFDSVWGGTGAMVKNDGKLTNEAVFWRFFQEKYGDRIQADRALFDAFYREDFDGAREACGFSAKAAAVIAEAKALGFRTALATNPIFPELATRKRIGWAGLSPDDFEYFTTYENSRYCKPNPEYYRELAGKLCVAPEECLMVGNDVEEDMAAGALGMSLFLLTDCLINRGGGDIEKYPRGDFDALSAHIRGLRKLLVQAP